MSPRRLLLSPYLLTALPPLFWAGNAVVGRAVVGELPPVAMSFWRWAVALAILLPVGLPLLLREAAVIRRHWRVLLALSVTSVTAYNTLLYLALQSTTAINATLVGSSLPIAILGLSWVWLGERTTPRQLAGFALSLAGVLAVIARGDPQVLLALELRPGDLWMLAATLSWAVYSVLLRRHPVPLRPVALLTLQVALGLLCLLPFYGWELALGLRATASPQTLAAILYVAVFASIAAYYFWNKGVAELGPGTAGQYAYLIPVFTAVLAVLFLGEQFQWFHAAGLVLIFGGIWVATRK